MIKRQQDSSRSTGPAPGQSPKTHKGEPPACASALGSALGDTALFPGSPPYGKAMGHLISADASLREPLCIVQPKDCKDVATAMKIAHAHGLPVCVRGGSHSTLCAANGAVMIDMARHMDHGTSIGNDARVQGGATMGTVLATLAPKARVVPIGAAHTPGMGLALQGGVGYLSRKLGLTLDFLQEIEIVVPSGDVLQLSDESTWDKADLWWAVRGCAPNFGVVTSATFRSRRLPSVFVQRMIVDLDALPAYFELAPSLPRDITASSVLGTPKAGSGLPVVFLYVVYAGRDAKGIQGVKKIMRELVARSGTTAHYEDNETVSYFDVPPFDVPGFDGSYAAPEAPGLPIEHRLFAYVKAYFLKASIDSAGAEKLAKCIQGAPTPMCRIDLQHLGGTIGDISSTATAFWNRNVEWNLVVTGAWAGSQGGREACTEWVNQTMNTLSPYVAGAYSVEVRPGLPETDRELEMAFGENLNRLSELKRKWDPDNVLRSYYPIGGQQP